MAQVSRLPGMGRREWLAGKVGLKMLGYAGKQALKRDDFHEATHILAMMAYGDSAHVAPCMLPDDIDARLAAYSAASRTEPATAAPRTAADCTGAVDCPGPHEDAGCWGESEETRREWYRVTT